MQEPLIIAHRGASGYLPEHTLEAKALAYGQGADFLEQDVVATRDRRLVVLHDLYLDDVTDVAEQYRDRCRADGHYYVVDFDLAEIRRLRVTERRRPGSGEALFPGRFPIVPVPFRIATLEEEINLIQGLNHTTGRRVGIYPELKDPAWHARHGIDLAELVLAQLDACGYRERDDPVFVQCFDAGELERLRRHFRTRLKTVLLLDDSPATRRLTAEGLKRISAFADALGLAYSSLLSRHGSGRALRAAPLAERARLAGLALHPYTFRADRLGDVGVDFQTLLGFFFAEIRVAGLFCDQPDLAVEARNAFERSRGQPGRAQ